MKLSYKRGFTLIELLVVIAIIGILSSVVLASLNSARQKGRDARRISDISQIRLALELYYDSNSTYPVGTIYGATLTSPGYISVVPQDPVSTVACTDGTQASCYGYKPLQDDGATACTPSEPCSEYVLSATLETANNSVFQSDIDTSFSGGPDCADPVYCQIP